MMASDVTAIFDGGFLRLIEKNSNVGAAQAVAVTEVNGRLVVDGLVLPNGTQTKINGQPRFVAPGVTSSLSVTLGGGNDLVRVLGVHLNGGLGISMGAPAGFTGSDSDSVSVISGTTIAGGLNINTGVGADGVTVAVTSVGTDLNVFTSAAQATAGADGDNVTVAAVNVRGKTHIETGVGLDRLLVQSATLGDSAADVTEIFTGAGADFLDIGTLSDQTSAPVLVTGNLDIRMVASLNSISDKDVDTLTIRDTTVRENLYAKMGEGSDKIAMENVTAFKTMLLEGQGGADTMKLTEVEAADGFFALMGDGDDVLDIIGLRARRMSVVGGSGFDRLFKFDVSNIPADSTSVTGFEQINGVPVLILATPTTPTKAKKA